MNALAFKLYIAEVTGSGRITLRALAAFDDLSVAQSWGKAAAEKGRCNVLLIGGDTPQVFAPFA